MRTNVELTCCLCHKDFTRSASEANRNAKRGRKVYCGNACSAKVKPAIRANWHNPDLVERHLKPRWGKGHVDEYSSFRYYVNKAKDRVRHGDTNLTVQYLKALWEEQGGKCAYTGILMDLPQTTCDPHIKAKGPAKASLDRIDSSKGYVEGNVEFVCVAVNFAKNAFSKEIMLDFFAKIRDTKPL